MASNYTEIIAQAKQEKEKSKNVGNPTSIQPEREETVNLCVRVPKSWRTKVKAGAIRTLCGERTKNGAARIIRII